MRPPIRTVWLMLVTPDTYQLENDFGQALTHTKRFGTFQKAYEWAEAWASSWVDVKVRVDERIQKRELPTRSSQNSKE